MDVSNAELAAQLNDLLQRYRDAVEVIEAWNAGITAGSPQPPLDIVFSKLGHSHADQYADRDHQHDIRYARLVHNHNDAYAAKAHDHAGIHAPVEHVHDDLYAAYAHHHDDVYAFSDHDHTPVFDLRYAGIGHVHPPGGDHNHDADYSAIAHDHDAAYAALAHDHAGIYSETGHVHAEYASISHVHDGDFASADHDHDADYADVAHTHTGFAAGTHNHDGTYADSGHNHDAVYSALGHTHADAGGIPDEISAALSYVRQGLDVVVSGSDVAVLPGSLHHWDGSDWQEQAITPADPTAFQVYLRTGAALNSGATELFSSVQPDYDNGGSRGSNGGNNADVKAIWMKVSDGTLAVQLGAVSHNTGAVAAESALPEWWRSEHKNPEFNSGWVPLALLMIDSNETIAANTVTIIPADTHCRIAGRR
ncbi:MAG: hypothetical protein AAF628_08330 [Planctomycetota bacterium]